MSESKHTPGPWYSTLVDDKYWVSQQPEGGTFWIAEITNGLMNNEEEPNARLIAAAPELLDACIAGLGAFVGVIQSEFQTTSDPRPEDAWPVVAQLRAAIAKAKGENHD